MEDPFLKRRTGTGTGTGTGRFSSTSSLAVVRFVGMVKHRAATTRLSRSVLRPRQRKILLKYLVICAVFSYAFYRYWSSYEASSTTTHNKSTTKTRRSLSTLLNWQNQNQNQHANEDPDTWGHWGAVSLPHDRHASTQAYVTTICSDEMLPSTRVLVHSIITSLTSRHVVVLATNDISTISRNQLVKLGARVIRIDTETCERAKLSTWKLTDYHKIIYINSTSIISDNIDSLFSLQTPAFPRITKTSLGTDLFVIQPNNKIYSDISRPTTHSLPSLLRLYFNKTETFRIPDKFSVRAVHDNIPPIIIPHVYHFSSTLNPTTFFQPLHSKSDISSFHSGMFAKFRRVDYEVQRLLRLGAWSNSKRHPYRKWSNRNHALDTCAHISSYYNSQYPINDKTSVLLSVNNADSISEQIESYIASGLVHRIYINYANRGAEIPHSLDEIQQAYSGAVIILPPHRFSSANARFEPIRGLSTQSILLTSDNTPPEQIADLFESWKDNPRSIHGLSSRVHTYDRGTDVGTEHGPIDSYTMVTGPMLFDSDLLVSYTCALPHEIHAYVDSHTECGDVAFNMLASGLTRQSPVLVGDGLPIHIKSRSKCVRDLVHLWASVATSPDSASSKVNGGRSLLDSEATMDPLVSTSYSLS